MITAIILLFGLLGTVAIAFVAFSDPPEDLPEPEPACTRESWQAGEGRVRHP